MLLNCEFWEAAAPAFTGYNLAARGYQTFDNSLLTDKTAGAQQIFSPKNRPVCGMRDAGCGMRDAGYGIPDAGGLLPALGSILTPRNDGFCAIWICLSTISRPGSAEPPLSGTLALPFWRWRSNEHHASRIMHHVSRIAHPATSPIFW
jgi:hypothetical protein